MENVLLILIPLPPVICMECSNNTGIWRRERGYRASKTRNSFIQLHQKPASINNHANTLVNLRNCIVIWVCIFQMLNKISHFPEQNLVNWFATHLFTSHRAQFATKWKLYGQFLALSRLKMPPLRTIGRQAKGCRHDEHCTHILQPTQKILMYVS